MSQVAVPTDEQRAAGRLWAIAGIVVSISACCSYVILVAYVTIVWFTTSTFPDPKILLIWVLATWASRSLGMQICIHKMQTIMGEKPTGSWLRLGFKAGLILVILAIVFNWRF